MKIVFATNNQNKVKEVQALLPNSIQILSLSDINCTEDIPETSPTIEGNAILKANYVKEKYGYDCFADDTGLEVEILNGAPGVYSARYAGEHKNSDDNMNKLLRELKGKSNRKARFKTVIVLLRGNEKKEFLGICEGIITLEKRGDQGFGYDPIFQPVGYTKTFAELPLAVKNNSSHRAIAVSKLISYLDETH